MKGSPSSGKISGIGMLSGSNSITGIAIGAYSVVMQVPSTVQSEGY